MTTKEPTAAVASATSLTMTNVEQAIRTIRGQRVMLDEDLAELYAVETKRLNEAVKRNMDRFPEDFAFRLTIEEADDLKSQIATSSAHGGRRRSTPMAFTEQGVAMLSSVLNSAHAVAVNIEIMRTFVRMRAVMMANAEVMRRLGLLEATGKRTAAELGLHKAEISKTLKVVFEALRQLSEQLPVAPESPREPIGFKTT